MSPAFLSDMSEIFIESKKKKSVYVSCYFSFSSLAHQVFWEVLFCYFCRVEYLHILNLGS